MINPKYLDKNGYPGTIQADGSYDGGDTAAIVGTIDYLNRSLLAVPIPIYIVPLRHPDTTKWYGQPDRFSRDQLIPVLCSCFQVPGRTFELFYAHKQKWFLTAWNTKGNGQMDMPEKFPDICGPEIWALWLRLLNPWWAPLILPMLDLQTLIGAIQWRWFTPKTNRVTRNHMLVSMVTKQYSPTLTSRLAFWINNWQDLIGRWEAHCAAVGECPTADLFKARLEMLT